MTTNLFLMKPTEKYITSQRPDYHYFINPKKDTITVEPTAKQIHYDTPGGKLGYRVTVKIG